MPPIRNVNCTPVSAIVGARSADQVDGWIDAATLELDRTDTRAIAAAIQRTGAGRGPADPEVATNVSTAAAIALYEIVGRVIE